MYTRCADVISVVIPTLNEAPRIGALLASLRAEPVACEAIVVDGGSTDGTVEIARAGGWARVLEGPRGRGPQLVLGAGAARGGVLLFLHADCRLPPGGLVALDRLLRDRPELVGGNFRLLFDGEDRFSRWLGGFYRWLRRCGFFYGDSGIFLRREAYEAIGGIRPLALMEDYDLVRRLRRAGPICCVAEPPLVTSSRRFAGRHPVGIVMGWVRIHLLYWFGTAPERLAAIYDSERRQGGG